MRAIKPLTLRMRLSGLCLALAALTAAGPTVAANPVELYNDACRASLAGDPAAAADALGAALAAGFDDIRYALRDPDLATARRDPAFMALLEGRQTELTALSGAAGFALASGLWSPALELAPDTAGAPAPTVRLKWVPTGLEVEVDAPGTWPGFGDKASLAPWAGGSGLVVSLLVPDGTSAFESGNGFMFAFGQEAGTPLGAVYQEGLDRWQPLHELETRLEDRDDRHLVTAVIPWQALLPYHPLTDPVLGVNVYLRLGDRDTARRARLFPDPRAADPVFPVKRYVPVTFRRETEPRESFLGRTDDSVVGPGPLDIHLTALSSGPGAGRLTLDFLDNQGQSVLAAGALTWPVDLQKGLNTFSRAADFTGLVPGPYLMRARLDLPSGLSATFSRTLLRLDDPWAGRLETRLNAVTEDDLPTVRRQMAAIDDALAAHRPRRNPGAILQGLTDLEKMVGAAERSGSILPASGPFLFTYPGPDGTDRDCSLYLPDGYRDAAVLHPVLVFTDVNRGHERLVSRLTRAYEYEAERDNSAAPSAGNVPVYLVPHLPAARGDIRAAMVREISTAVAWASRRFDTPRVSVAGVDYPGGPALEAALATPDHIGRLVVFAGRHLVPYPNAQRDFLRDRLSPVPGDLTVTWFDFQQETALAEQPAMLFSILEELGYTVDETQTVRGGLNLTQVADRLYLWAEGRR